MKVMKVPPLPRTGTMETINVKRKCFPLNLGQVSPSSKARSITGRSNSSTTPLKIFTNRKKPQATNPFESCIQTTSRSTPSSPMTKPTTHTIMIRILSNYGNDRFVSCSEIDVLSNDRIPINLKNAYIPPARTYTNGLEKLFNRNFIKSNENDMWKHEWPPLGNHIDIHITVQTDREIKSLRIWPNTQTENSNLRQIMVLYDGVPSFKGELNSKLGTNINLFKPKPNDLPLFTYKPEDCEITRIPDGHGIDLPVQLSQQISINILSAYHNRGKYGISMIRLYDFTGNLIDIRKNGTVDIIDSGEVKDPWVVFEESDNSEHFVGVLNQRSALVVNFPKPFPVSAVEIINQYDADPQENVGVHRISIKSDNNIRWVGNISMRTMSDSFDSMKTKVVYFSDSQSIKSEITRFIQRAYQFISFN